MDIIKYIRNNLEDLNIYYNTLENTTLIKIMKKEPEIKHSIKLKIKDHKTNDNNILYNLSGEADFISKSYITDIKVCKDDDINKWFAQTFIY